MFKIRHFDGKSFGRDHLISSNYYASSGLCLCIYLVRVCVCVCVRVIHLNYHHHDEFTTTDFVFFCSILLFFNCLVLRPFLI
ncbi:hypothetical protein FB192DRAFT_1403861 [Mucor lusitanicus]|uniref:Uncharacterized protein n=1 Tax=Mucor circinelloides f. lusitanicus TaxID=29924 RepID=A0A8H4B7M3_MUCCL|nr:hypothetical protein FB192DRAFT_1403861 [Mucor lusitanicus]